MAEHSTSKHRSQVEEDHTAKHAKNVIFRQREGKKPSPPPVNDDKLDRRYCSVADPLPEDLKNPTFRVLSANLKTLVPGLARVSENPGTRSQDWHAPPKIQGPPTGHQKCKSSLGPGAPGISN